MLVLLPQAEQCIMMILVVVLVLAGALDCQAINLTCQAINLTCQAHAYLAG